MKRFALVCGVLHLFFGFSFPGTHRLIEAFQASYSSFVLDLHFLNSGKSMPWIFQNFGRHFERVESWRDPGQLNACGHTRMAQFFLKIDLFGTTHGDKPTSQNDISSRCPPLIMVPDFLRQGIMITDMLVGHDLFLI